MFTDGTHAATCPHDKSEGSKERRSWRQGKADGVSGKAKDVVRAARDKLYNLGFIVGRIPPAA